ncbi:MAG: type IV secretory system conjugative DNA transfer family protein [Gammaproteobacteria bacterium]
MQYIQHGFILGKYDDQFIRTSQPGHEIVFALTRSGKCVGLAIPNLFKHQGSVVVNVTVHKNNE